MMDNRAKMIEARIPVEAQQTTLSKLGWVSLREGIVAGNPSPMVFAPKDIKNVEGASLLFYTYAKETRLSGSTLVCVSLAELVAVVFNDLEEFRSSVLAGVTARTLQSMDALAVSGFCDTGTTFLTPQQKYTVASFLLTMMRNGKKVILGLDADRPLDTWWPTQLAMYLVKNATFTVCGGGK
jgi:hypothetical protein